MRQFLSEFKAFAVRGNAIDLAVGVVIGAAFNQITSSLANNVLTPPIGLLFGGLDFTKLEVPLGGKSVIAFGLFLQAIFNFIIIAFALFLIVKVINRLQAKRKEEEKLEAKQPAENPELKVLLEIRDALRAQSGRAS